MSQRAAVTKAKATAYARADRVRKTQILDELVELTRWHRDYARAALRQALVLKIVTPRTPRGPTYDPRVMTALITCWAVLRAPAGKRLAPMLPTLVPILRRDGELDLTDAEADLLCRMSAATIDRRLAGERAKLFGRGRSHTKPGSLLKSQIPVRTWADWDDAVPGFVEIDLVGHEGGNASGEFCFTLTVTDIATGWTVNRSVKNKAAKWVFEALEHVICVFPFPILKQTHSAEARRAEPMLVRVIDYTIDDGRDNPTTYRLFTTLLDPNEVSATELAAAYTQRWEIELAFDELKTHQRGPRTVLRSKSPDLVLQEIWGHLCCHYAIRSLMTHAATHSGHDPDRVSFVAALRITRQSIAQPGAFPPDQHHDSPGWLIFLRRLINRLNPTRRARANPRVIKRKYTKWHVKRAHHANWPHPNATTTYTTQQH